MPLRNKTCTIILWTAVGFAVLLLASRLGSVRQPGSSAHAVSLGAPEADDAAEEALAGAPTRFAEFDTTILRHAERLLRRGRQTFRFDTFGSEAFWGDQLRLHEAIQGAPFGGVGPGISPRRAMALGLKVDVEALPPAVIRALRTGQLNLDDPAVTLTLLELNAVVGLTGRFTAAGHLRSIGIQCALCHSTVNDALAPGIGQRLDGFANRDLDIGTIIAAAPTLQPFVDLLRIVDPTMDAEAVRAVLTSWGPGKFDAELLLDGKVFRPDGQSAATLIPNAFGLAGHNNHTWTGAWGTVTYWNAFVGILEMHGTGTFFDPRLDNADQFPIAAAAGFGHVQTAPDQDRITRTLPALHFYQLAIPAPRPRPGIDFDPAAAARGAALFVDKAGCNRCHVKPLWTEPGWNLHTPEEIGIDDFQANRSPDKRYRTMNLAGLFVRERGLFMRPEHQGRFYHDGRFQTLLDVINHYDSFFALNLTAPEKQALVEYLKSL
jgi:hypothetical protein